MSTEITGYKGKPHTAYFGIVVLDNDGKEIDRKIQWLNDFSGIRKKIRIVLKSPSQKAIIIYRINAESPIKSDCHYELQSLDEISINEVDSSTDELFDSVNNFIVPKKNPLSDEEELILEKNLVWVCAFGRSGSTWLARNLLSYNTQYIHEPEINEHLALSLFLPDGRIVRRMELRSEDDSYFFSKAHKDTWIFYLKKMILNRFYAQVNDLERKIIVKEAGSVDSSDIISMCFPNSKIIMLFRDGRDIVDSGIDGRQKEGWMTKQLKTKPMESKERIPHIEMRSKRWTVFTKNLLNTYNELPEESRYMIKYEDLRKNTLEELEKIYKFLEIDISKDELQKRVNKFSFENIPDKDKGKGKFARSATPGKWKENFSVEEKRILNNIMNESLKKLGY